MATRVAHAQSRSSSASSHSSAASPLFRFLLRNFVIFNPLFLFSATAVLGGAWLLNPPNTGGGRSLSLLFQLIALIQLYEFTLIGAGALLAKHTGLERDVRNLMLVLSPFLLDVTFTSSSLVVSMLNQVGAGSATILAGSLVGLAAVKARFAARLLGMRFKPLEWTTLLAGPALVTLYPLSGAWLAGQHFQSEVGLLGGVVVSALILLYGFTGSSNLDGPLRKLAPLALVAAFAHVSGTVWTYSGELTHMAGPMLIALGATLPLLGWPRLAPGDRVTPVLLPAIGALVCGATEILPFGLSGWHLGLAGFAAVQAVFFYRHRSLQFLSGLLLAGHLAWGGVSVSSSLAAIGSNAVEPVALFALFGYGLWRRSHPALLALALGLGAVLSYRLHLFGAPGASALDAVLALDLVGLGLLAWSHRMHGGAPRGARTRFAGVFLLVVPVTALALAQADSVHLATTARVITWCTVITLLVPFGITRLRVYGLPFLILPSQAAAVLAPTSSAGWGMLGIASAFALVTLGVFVSLRRERLLAWLESADQREAEAGAPVVRPTAPDVWTSRAAMGVALVSAVGWVLLAPTL